MDGGMIELNVGGVFYTTTKSTLLAEAGSMLAAIVTSGLPSRRDANGRIFIDRDGHRFRNVLNYLRSAAFHCIDDRTALRELAEEAEFFGLEKLLKSVRSEISRIELEEDLGARSSAHETKASMPKSSLQLSPSATRAFGQADAKVSSMSSDSGSKHVARTLLFESSVSRAEAAAHVIPKKAAAATPPAAQEQVFTLDADF